MQAQQNFLRARNFNGGLHGEAPLKAFESAQVGWPPAFYAKLAVTPPLPACCCSKSSKLGMATVFLEVGWPEWHMVIHSSA